MRVCFRASTRLAGLALAVFPVLLPALLPALVLTGLAAPVALAGRVFTCSLDGSQEVPPVESPGSGTAELFLHDDGTTARVRLRVEGLENEIVAAHIHLGPPGTNGFQIFDLGDFEDSLQVDWEPILPSLREALLGGGVYINVHTDVHLDGEIRGQIDPQPCRSLRADLSGVQEVPPNGSGGIGGADLTLWDAGTRLHLDLSVSGLEGEIVDAHIHRGEPGENGPPVFAIGAFEERAVIDFAVTPEEAADLLAGGFYVNVHTTAFPGGEIRGQVFENTPVSVSETPGPEGDGRFGMRDATARLRILPNPARESVTLRWVPVRSHGLAGGSHATALGSHAFVARSHGGAQGIHGSAAGGPHGEGRPVGAHILDASGRLVRTLSWPGADAAEGGAEIRWDLRNEAGLPVPAGVYFVRAAAAASAGADDGRASAAPAAPARAARLVVLR